MTLASTSRGIGVSIPCDAFPSDAEQLAFAGLLAAASYALYVFGKS